MTLHHLDAAMGDDCFTAEINQRRRGLKARLHPRFAFARRVPAGALLPWGYGVAWFHFGQCECVAMPMPFNVLARLGRDAWLWVKHFGSAMPESARAAYEAGRREEREFWTAFTGL